MKVNLKELVLAMLVVIIALVLPASAGVAVVNTQSLKIAWQPATSHTLAGFNSTGADKLVVAVCGEGSGGTSTLIGVTFGGVAMTEAIFKTHIAGSQSAAVYYLDNPVGTGDIVTYWSSNVNGAGIGAVALSGTADGVDFTAFNDNSRSVTFSTETDYSFVVAASVGNGASATANPPLTQFLGGGDTGSCDGAAGYVSVATAGQITASFTGSTVRPVTVAAVFKEPDPSPITVVNSNSYVVGWANPALTTHTLSNFDPAGGNKLVVAINAECSGTIQSVTFGGVAMTQAVSYNGGRDAAIYYLDNPSAVGNIAATFTVAVNGCAIGAVSLAGTAAGVGNTAAAAASSVTVPTGEDYTFVLGTAVCNNSYVVANTPLTLLYSLSNTASCGGSAGYIDVPTAGNVTASFTAGSTIEQTLAAVFKADRSKAYDLWPVNSAVGIDPDVVLSWAEGIYAAGLNDNAVYFGDNYSAVASADVTDTTGIFKGQQTSNSYTPGTLQDGKTYYWRVDEHNDSNPSSPWIGPVCSFTVGLAKYRFFGVMSRNVTEAYLSHAITQGDLCNRSSLAGFNENKRMLKNIGAKFICRAALTWDVPASSVNGKMADYPAFFAKIGDYAARMLAEDPEMILQGTIFEIVQKSTDSSGTLVRAGVDQVAIPAWVFEAFSQPVVTRNFVYEDMLYLNGSYVNHWGDKSSIPDISRLETRMYFYYRARSFIDAGFESIHFGQISAMDNVDTGHVNTIDLFDRVRDFAALHARRGFILLDSDALYGNIVENGELLFDIGCFPLRIKEDCSVQYNGILQVNWIDSLYGRTVGGTTPSGWYCDHIPYNVSFDVSGAVENPGRCSAGVDIWPWGWDEICWFSHCSNTYRNYWLGYAVNWLKTNDKIGYVRMPGKPSISGDTLDINGDGIDEWYYYANMPSAACPVGFGQEETIKALWADIDKPAAPTGLTATAGNNQVVLDWANNTEFDLASYNVYRSTTSGSYGTPLATGVTTSNYTDNTAVNNTTYYYVVTAVDTFGEESAKSSQVSVMPYIAAPTFVATGAVASGTGTITPALPSGIASGDILLLFLETSNQAVSITNQNGGTWTAVTNSPQYCGTAASTTGARLTAFWSRYNGTQGAPTVSDSGDHQLGRMIAIRGAVSSGNPWDVTAGGVEAVSDTSGSIAGATTTVNNTLVVVAIAASLPDASSTAKFSGWTNANLTSLTERTDNSVTAGNGGGLGIATGLKATAGAYGNTAVTLVNAAYKGMMSIAIRSY